MRPKPSRSVPAIITLWGLAVAGWFAYLYAYSNAPGQDGPAPVRWPADSTISHSLERSTLLMFVHPKCPCTRASLEELSRIIAHCQGRADFLCVFVRPAGLPQDWEKDELWRLASAIPQVRLIVDEGGREARQFGATTSGHVRLYDRNGVLLFGGGITGARSHAGDNAGASAVMDWLLKGHSECSKTFVFGCSLF
jgi:hypothetical protein